MNYSEICRWLKGKDIEVFPMSVSYHLKMHPQMSAPIDREPKPMEPIDDLFRDLCEKLDAQNKHNLPMIWLNYGMKTSYGEMKTSHLLVSF